MDKAALGEVKLSILSICDICLHSKAGFCELSGLPQKPYLGSPDKDPGHEGNSGMSESVLRSIDLAALTETLHIYQFLTKL